MRDKGRLGTNENRGDKEARVVYGKFLSVNDIPEADTIALIFKVRERREEINRLKSLLTVTGLLCGLI